jgi:purine-nucleoside/S-methyl-5'-thioadenosine phosphorylase / adenosine deaminase
VRWRERDGVRWLEAELPGARAAFTTRLGGASKGRFESLNLGRLTGDPAVRENRHRLAASLGVEPDLVLIGRQVHGAHVIEHDGPTEPRAYADPAPGLTDADGHATAQPGLVPLVFVADCLPVALAGDGAVAMIHCGWRGLAGGIVRRGVKAVGARAAAIGPGIGPCCYEVGEEVLAAFERLGPGIASGRMLDLRLVARRLLEDAGVEHVEITELCTFCNPDLFFSHRRDGEPTGRQAGLVWASDEVPGHAKPAATPALQPAGNGAEGEASGGGVVWP